MHVGVFNKVKQVKATHVQAWTFPEGCKKLRLPELHFCSKKMLVILIAVTDCVDPISTIRPESEKFQRHHRESNPRTPVCSTVSVRTAPPRLYFSQVNSINAKTGQNLYGLMISICYHRHHSADCDKARS
jgi:hypothetical protein